MLQGFYPEVSITMLCKLFGISRQAWYANQDREKAKQDFTALVIELVQLLRSSMPRLGTNKLYHIVKPELEKHGIQIGRDKLHFLLRDNELLIRNRRNYKTTTRAGTGLPVFPDLLIGAVILNPELFWVADITYIHIGKAFNYLSLITDAYSRLMVGYCLHETLSAEGCAIALEMALSQRIYSDRQLTHHSDRGFQYRSTKYLSLLNENKIWSSMTQNGSPYENAIAERVNGILKKEFSIGRVFADRDSALLAVEKAVMVYNSLRPHSSCDYLTPKVAHQQSGELRKRWKPNREKARVQEVF